MTETVAAAVVQEPPPEPVPDLRQELIAANVQNSRLEGQIAEFKQQIRKLRDELKRVTGERDEAIAYWQQLTLELEADRETLQTYLGTIESQEATIDSLQQQVRQGDADLTETRRHLADTQEERTVGLREIQALQHRIANKDEESISLWAELTAATTKADGLKAELGKVRENLTAAESAGETLRSELAELTKERDSLRRSVSESGLGQELVAVREQLATAEKEGKRLSLHARQLTSDVDAAERARKERDELIRTLKTELDQTRRSAAASSEVKINNDNEVLRGIIARQNAELEQRHVQLVRLKRARLGVQLMYAFFALTLAGIVFWALKMVPKLKPGALLDF